MKIIDLLNKIANGEEVPKEIKLYGDIYKYTGECSKNYSTELEDLFSVIDGSMLNDEIEVIEESKKIEKIKDEIDVYEDSYYDTALLKLAGKIDEIIDYINRGDKDEI